MMHLCNSGSALRIFQKILTIKVAKMYMKIKSMVFQKKVMGNGLVWAQK